MKSFNSLDILAILLVFAASSTNALYVSPELLGCRGCFKHEVASTSNTTMQTQDNEFLTQQVTNKSEHSKSFGNLTNDLNNHSYWYSKKYIRKSVNNNQLSALDHPFFGIKVGFLCLVMFYLLFVCCKPSPEKTKDPEAGNIEKDSKNQA